MKYKLKEEYKGVIVTRNHMSIGKVTFDANIVKEEHYENYVKLGFDELFEEIVETIVEAVVDAIVDKVEDIVDNIKAKRKVKNKS
jgi:Mg2+ and Co2+ transporter CorA